jgi:hypothetical protein
MNYYSRNNSGRQNNNFSGNQNNNANSNGRTNLAKTTVSQFLQQTGVSGTTVGVSGTTFTPGVSGTTVGVSGTTVTPGVSGTTVGVSGTTVTPGVSGTTVGVSGTTVTPGVSGTTVQIPTTRPNPSAVRPVFPAPTGQIQVQQSVGATQTVQAIPLTEAIEVVLPCLTCQPETAAEAAGAVTLPASVWQIPGYNGGTSGITTLPANVSELPTVGISTLPAPAPEFKDCLQNFPLAMCYVPMQKWETPYKETVGFEAGTIFPSLNLKFDAEKGCAVK